MTKTLLALLLTTSLQAATLTNQDIVQLVTAKLATTLILTTITSSETHFDTRVTALIQLRKAGVPNDVLLAMLQATTPATASTAAAALSVVRLEFPDSRYRVSRARFYKGILRVYDDRLTFVPHREDFQEYALSIPWARVVSLCYEKGPFYGDLHLQLRDPEEQRILGTDPPMIIAMKNTISTFTKRPIPECE